MSVKVVVGKDILAANKKKASELKARFGEMGIKVVNMLSSPGAGKTSVLEATIPRLRAVRAAVIEGDVATTRDAERLSHLGIPLVQITTLGACHLDSSMIWQALGEMDLSGVDLLFIENVGNLVCPASFDLGENLRLVVLSVAEGTDKPAKYPAAFLSSQVVLINKMDLVPYTDFDLGRVLGEIRTMRPDAKVFTMSCRSGEGIDEWAGWLEKWVKGGAPLAC